MPTYKVLTQQDKALTGRFSPARLEDALNELAGQGWRVVGMVTAEFGGFSKRDELVVLLEHP